MKFKTLIVFPLVFSLIIGPSALARTQEDTRIGYAMLNVAAHYNAASDKIEFLKSAFLKVSQADRKFLESGLARLKGANFPQMSLSAENAIRFSYEGHSFEIQMIDLKARVLKLNGISLHLDSKKSLEANYQDMEQAVKQTLHAFHLPDLLIPQAHAAVWMILVAIAAWLGIGIGFFMVPEIERALDSTGVGKDLIPCLEKMEQLKAEGAVSKQVTPLPGAEIQKSCTKIGINEYLNATTKSAKPIEFEYLDHSCAFEKALDHCVVELTKLYTAKKMDTTNPMSHDQLTKVGDYLKTVSTPKRLSIATDPN